MKTPRKNSWTPFYKITCFAALLMSLTHCGGVSTQTSDPSGAAGAVLTDSLSTSAIPSIPGLQAFYWTLSTGEGAENPRAYLINVPLDHVLDNGCTRLVTSEGATIQRTSVQRSKAGLSVIVPASVDPQNVSVQCATGETIPLESGANADSSSIPVTIIDNPTIDWVIIFVNWSSVTDERGNLLALMAVEGSTFLQGRSNAVGHFFYLPRNAVPAGSPSHTLPSDLAIFTLSTEENAARVKRDLLVTRVVSSLPNDLIEQPASSIAADTANIAGR